MFTVKYNKYGNKFTRVVECTTFNYAVYSPQESCDVMSDRKLQYPPFAELSLVFADRSTEDIFLYNGDTAYVENSTAKTTVVLR